MRVWRKIGSIRRNIIRRRADSFFARRLERGAVEYPNQIFYGDPLDHALEEIDDFKFYVMYAAIEREQYYWLERNICDDCRQKHLERNGRPDELEHYTGELAGFARKIRSIYDGEKKSSSAPGTIHRSSD